MRPILKSAAAEGGAHWHLPYPIHCQIYIKVSRSESDDGGGRLGAEAIASARSILGAGAPTARRSPSRRGAAQARISGSAVVDVPLSARARSNSGLRGRTPRTMSWSKFSSASNRERAKRVDHGAAESRDRGPPEGVQERKSFLPRRLYATSSGRAAAARVAVRPSCALAPSR